VRADDRRYGHLPPAGIAVGGRPFPFEARDRPSLGGGNRGSGLVTSLALPELDPRAHREPGKIVDLHDAQPAGVHEFPSTAEIEHRNAIGRALQDLPAEIGVTNETLM